MNARGLVVAGGLTMMVFSAGGARAGVGGVILVADFGRTVSSGSVASSATVFHAYSCVDDPSTWAYPSTGDEPTGSQVEVLHLGADPCTCSFETSLENCPSACSLATGTLPVSGDCFDSDPDCLEDGLTAGTPVSAGGGRYYVPLSIGYEADTANPDILLKITGSGISDTTTVWEDLALNSNHTSNRVSYQTPSLATNSWYYILLAIRNEPLCESVLTRYGAGESENWRLKVTSSPLGVVLETWRP